MFESVSVSDFERMFSVHGLNMIAVRRWWSERGLRESCECVARSSCYKYFWTCLFTLFDTLNIFIDLSFLFVLIAISGNTASMIRLA